MNRPLSAMLRRSWPVAIALAMLLSVGAASAGATTETSEIEGVWSFNGGEVDVVAVPGGKFEGIVTVPTKFDECTHSEGEHMWTAITPQPDGSYWGLHQWFHSAPTCAKNTTLGPTAWRVLHEPNGSRFLRVCFSDPGSTQPTIAPGGAPMEASEYSEHHVTYGCVNSALTAPLPVVSGRSGSGSTESLTLPSAKQCLKPGLFKFRLKEPKYDPFKKITITVRGHRVATSRKGDYVVATINLRGLSKGGFTIKVRATTILGHHLSLSRTYHVCKKIKPKKRGRKAKKAAKKG
jgi:hypothetical protein